MIFLHAFCTSYQKAEGMEFSQLRYFSTVASSGNFTRAAAELGLSQPALSRAIARLEDELGQPVFERRPRTVTLTDAGRLLRARAQEVLTIISNTKAEITDDGQTGTIRVGAIPTIAPYFLPRVLSEFARDRPRAVVQVIEDVTEGTIKRCDDGDIDLAIVALPIATKYLEVEDLFEEELLLVLPPRHPLGRKRRITIDDLKPHPFVLLDEAHCLSGQIVSYCQRRSIQPVAMERTSQLATVQELVALDHGVSMVPAMAQRIDKSRRRRYRSLVNPTPKRRIAMIWNPYRFQSRLLEAFKGVLRRTSAV
jgi:LysR family hydrogen peroxide-inducible transcriptional activator